MAKSGIPEIISGKMSLLIIMAAVLTATNLSALDGSWRGNLKIGLTSLPVVFNFVRTNGATVCTMDSPSQKAYGIPISVDYLSPDSISVTAGSIGAIFTGRTNGDEIDGTFSQMGHRIPLTLKRDLSLLERRPQTPCPPYPYQTVDTVFMSTDNTILAGTFALPENFEKGKTPMCVLITGSGPQNRDEEIFDHRPFAVIADFLARNGVATLRYDDRGTAASEGDYAAATISTFCEDARAALTFAKSFSNGPTGAIGHSEGGTIALLLAENGVPDYVVSLAGMAVSGKETIMNQNRRVLRQAGFDATAVNDVMALISEIFDEIIRQYKSGEPYSIDVEAIASSLGISNLPSLLMRSLKTNIAQANTYFGSCLSTDVRDRMQDISCPVLGLNGELDTQVDADDNLDAIGNGIRNASVLELPGLNHLFQHATTGNPEEYPEISETISPEVLSLILSFILDIGQ